MGKYSGLRTSSILMNASDIPITQKDFTCYIVKHVQRSDPDRTPFFHNNDPPLKSCLPSLTSFLLSCSTIIMIMMMILVMKMIKMVIGTMTKVLLSKAHLPPDSPAPDINGVLRGGGG